MKKARSQGASALPAEAEIAEVTGSGPLASAIHSSIAAAVRSRAVHVGVGDSVADVFRASLNAAIRDVESHPRGKLLRRLIQYGPPDPEDPEALTSDGETTLSDQECGQCVDFIYSHMVNCFKGELAELLALQPTLLLMKQLRKRERIAPGVRLYWGGSIGQRRRMAPRPGQPAGTWSKFAKGADGLLVRLERTRAKDSRRLLVVHGIVEVKSMARSVRQVLAQIERHRTRLLGGVRLGSQEWPSSQVQLAESEGVAKAGEGLIRVVVLPSRWRLSRAAEYVRVDAETRRLRTPEPPEPPVETRTEDLGGGGWKITLAWSQEALSQAAYEMTSWYMAQVGRYVFTRRPKPRGWESMTPEEVGSEIVKHRLYGIATRYLSRRQDQRLLRIYNSHCFGFALAADIQGEELWPAED